MDAISQLAARGLGLASGITTTPSQEAYGSSYLHKRATFEDSYDIFNRKRNAHACIMSIVFIVLFPLGAMSLHLPIQGVVRRIVTRVHAPIQILGLVMMIGAMGLGIDMAKNDLHYISPAKAHVILGLLTTSIIILVQPALGILHHVMFKKTQKKTVYGYIHRYTGRITIIMGWVNSYLGFKLYGFDLVKSSSIARNFSLMGVLGGIWFLLVGVDFIERHFFKNKKNGASRRGWKEVVGGPKKGEADKSVKGELDAELNHA